MSQKTPERKEILWVRAARGRRDSRACFRRPSPRWGPVHRGPARRWEPRTVGIAHTSAVSRSCELGTSSGPQLSFLRGKWFGPLLPLGDRGGCRPGNGVHSRRSLTSPPSAPRDLHTLRPSPAPGSSGCCVCCFPVALKGPEGEAIAAGDPRSWVEFPEVTLPSCVDVHPRCAYATKRRDY